jgi:hypothetical protein
MGRPKGWAVLRVIATSQLERRFWRRCSWRGGPRSMVRVQGKQGECRHFRHKTTPHWATHLQRAGRIPVRSPRTRTGPRPRRPTGGDTRVPARWPLLAGTRVSVWRTAGGPACVRPEGLLILRPVVRIVAAHLPLHLLQHIGGWPPDVGATRTTFIADRPPCHPDLSVPRLQGQRAAGAIGAEGMGDQALEKHGERGWGGLGPHHRRPNCDRQPGALECPNDDRVGVGPRPLGEPPRGEALEERPKEAA